MSRQSTIMSNHFYQHGFHPVRSLGASCILRLCRQAPPSSSCHWLGLGCSAEKGNMFFESFFARLLAHSARPSILTRLFSHYSQKKGILPPPFADGGLFSQPWPFSQISAELFLDLCSIHYLPIANIKLYKSFSRFKPFEWLLWEVCHILSATVTEYSSILSFVSIKIITNKTDGRQKRKKKRLGARDMCDHLERPTNNRHNMTFCVTWLNVKPM